MLYFVIMGATNIWLLFSGREMSETRTRKFKQGTIWLDVSLVNIYLFP